MLSANNLCQLTNLARVSTKLDLWRRALESKGFGIRSKRMKLQGVTHIKIRWLK